MLIAYGFLETARDGAICVQKITNGFRISVAGEGGWDFEFTSAMANSCPSIALLALNRFGRPRLIWGHEVFNERAAMAYALSRNDIPPEHPFLAALAVDETGEPHCFLMRNDVHAPEIACVIELGGRSFTEVLQAHVPSLQPYLRKALAKRELLAQVVYADSLAALEAQVDLLTQVVTALVPFLSEVEQPSMARALAGVVAAHGVTALHPPQKLLADITSHKQKLRELQGVYLVARNGGA